MSEECQHDWRVNPFKLLPSNPPQVELFCIKCSKITSAPFHFKKKVSNKHDPRTWKKYTGEVEEVTCQDLK